MARIDKYLWAVRLYKTRSDATDAVKNGKVTVNGHSVKAAYEVHIGDTIEKKVPPIQYSFRVLDIITNRQPAKNVSLYIENITPQSEYDRLELIKFESYGIRDKGTGRPTKQDRRRLEEFMDENPLFSEGDYDDDEEDY